MDDFDATDRIVLVLRSRSAEMSDGETGYRSSLRLYSD
jgi:hypothetical protein